MKAFAVINPILEAIKYFYLKANNTCIRQKIDNIIRNREVTAEQAEAIMHPAMVLERFLDENIVMLDLPDPEWPTRKMNSPAKICRETSLRAGLLG